MSTSSYIRGCKGTVLVFSFKWTWSLMPLKNFMSFCSQNLRHTKMKCSNFSTTTLRFGLIYPWLSGSYSGRKCHEKRIDSITSINLNAFIDVFSYNKELCNGVNASGIMSGKFVSQNGDLISSCSLINLLWMNGLWIANMDGHVLTPNV